MCLKIKTGGNLDLLPTNADKKKPNKRLICQKITPSAIRCILGELVGKLSQRSTKQ
jgi:hypothetical protein